VLEHLRTVFICANLRNLWLGLEQSQVDLVLGLGVPAILEERRPLLRAIAAGSMLLA
jgi:hypothetical protein